jgi:pyridoxamine 5'-phosphate oxidase
VAEVAQRFAAEEEVPLPPFWGGYRIVPTAIEFWQGRQDRLHDRVRYEFGGDTWRRARLGP